MVKQTGVLGRHVGPLNTAGSLLKGKSSGLHICPLYPDSNSMLSKCCSSDMLVSDNEWCPTSRPLHNFTAIREIAITLAFPIQLSQNDSLLLVNQLHPTAYQPTCTSTGCCVTSLHPLLRAPSYSDCTCTKKCTSLLLPPASFIPHCRATEVSAPWNEPQHAENVVQFLERMKLQPSRSCGFLLLWCWSMLGLIRHFSRLSGIGKSCGCLICHVQFRTACVFPLFQSTLRELTSV